MVTVVFAYIQKSKCDVVRKHLGWWEKKRWQPATDAMGKAKSKSTTAGARGKQSRKFLLLGINVFMLALHSIVCCRLSSVNRFNKSRQHNLFSSEINFRFELNITTVEPWIATSNDLPSCEWMFQGRMDDSHLPNLVVMVHVNPQRWAGLPTENTNTFLFSRGLFSPAVLWKAEAPHKPQAAKWGVHH